MNAANTTSEALSPRGWVFYDGECRFCVHGATRWGGFFARRGFHWLPLQTPDTTARLGMTEAALREEMKLLHADGRIVGGVDAWAFLFRSVWWLWPLGLLLSLPGARWFGGVCYRWVARNRYCISGACRMPRRNPLVSWLPLMVLLTTAFVVHNRLPAWLFMWVMAFALYAGCKWLTYREAVARGIRATPLLTAGYLLAWIGMDAKNFLDAKAAVKPARENEWLFAFVKTLSGAVLVWVVARRVPQDHGLFTGWMAMVGVILLLHCGWFHLLSLAWRAAGVDAAPLMQNPLRAGSLAEFWGKRWNTAFHELVHRFTFRPMVRRLGATGATLLVFLMSGLVHELLISLPAGGGYGLPTGYFLIQGLGIAGEHSRPGRRLGLGHGWCGWLFTMLVTIAPAFWLFHPPFIRSVILPMLHAIGAT